MKTHDVTFYGLPNFETFLAMLCSVLLAVYGCSSVTDSKEQDDNTPPVQTKLEITETSPEFVFWGDNLTISGTGFSTKTEDNYVWLKNAKFRSGQCDTSNDSTGWQKATVLSATPTTLTIRVPYVPGTQTSNGKPCGVFDPQISVTVAGKTVVSNKVKLVGIPVIDRICYTNSGWAFSGLVPGKELKNTVAITGMGIYANSSGTNDNVTMTIAGKPIDLERVVPEQQTCAGGYNFVVPIELASGECTPDPIRTGTYARNEVFIARVGTKVSPPFSYPIRSFPERSVQTFTEKHFSKSAGGNPEIVLKGKNLQSYKTARFVGNTACSQTTIAPVPRGDDLVVGVPLYQLTAGCNYNLSLEDVCKSNTGLIGIVRINP